MQIPTQVTFRDMPVSDEIEAACLEEAEKLERYSGRITSCRVMVRKPHHRRHRGDLYRVSVDLTVPGGEIVINREHPEDEAHTDIGVAIRRAFDAARRRIEDHVRKHTERVKTPHELPTGLVSTINVDEGFGFIRGLDVREFYFHRNSVLDDAFDRLSVGAEVRFAEELGEEGPQASTVRLVSTSRPTGSTGQQPEIGRATKEARSATR